MKYYLSSIAAAALLLTSCNTEPNPFNISKQHVGLVTDSTQVKDLKSIFINDSIATETNKYNNTTVIEVFGQTKEHLLTLTQKREQIQLQPLAVFKFTAQSIKQIKDLQP